MSQRQAGRMRPAIAVLGIAFFVVACSLTDGSGGSAAQMLKQTISGLSGQDDFRFEGTMGAAVGQKPLQTAFTFSGSVQSHNRLSIQMASGLNPANEKKGGEAVSFVRKNGEWTYDSANAPVIAAELGDMLLMTSPIYMLEQLNRIDKAVQGEQAPNDRKLLTLTAIPSVEAATEMAKSYMLRPVSALDTEQKLATLRQKVGLSARVADELRETLDREVTQLRRRVDEAGSTLRAESVYRIVMDRATRLPREMRIDTDMTYMENGTEKHEQLRFDYTFREYGG